MGALASIKQKHDVAEKVAELSKDAKIVFGGNESFKFNADHPEKGAFLLQLYCYVSNLYKQPMFTPQKLSVLSVPSCHIKALKNWPTLCHVAKVA